MLCRSRLAVPLLALLAAALLAGCGGGEQTEGSGDGGQGQDQQQDQQQQESKKEAQETKIAVGNVVAVQPDRRRMVVQPSQQAEGAEKVALNVRKTAEIKLGDQKAEMGDIAEGQQAQAEYIVKNEVNRAVSVQLFEAEGSPEEQPQGEDTSN
jgi:major membrane immunogen (membrane-anchored lipoprotein)